MNRRDFYSSAFLLALAIAVCAGAWTLRIGSPREPGPGFMPFLCGLALCGLSFFLFVQSLRIQKAEVAAHRSVQLGRSTWLPGITLFSLTLYLVILKFLGFLLATFVLLLFLTRIIGSQSIRRSLVTAVSISGSLFFIFQVFLRLKMPEGPFGF
jgi:uncharacterized membrane protein YcfT